MAIDLFDAQFIENLEVCFEPTLNRALPVSSVALAATAASRPAINAWIVAAAVIIPTFMQVLDTGLVLAAAQDAQGDLPASGA